VTHHEGGANQSSFSHDGTLLAFHSGPSTFTIGLDGADERIVATGPDSYNGYANPQFTPDDAGVVVDRNNEIDVFTLGSSEQRMIVQNWTTTIQAPSLSPSGRDVVYQVNCDFDARKSLWTSPYSVNTEPCKGVRITPANEVDSEHPSWGPDDRIVYTRVDDANNTGQIAIVRRERGATQCAVTELGADNRNPVWHFSAE
jgi:Tol biopolymer transport system component